MHCTSCGHKIVFALKFQGESRDCEKCSSTQILQPEPHPLTQAKSGQKELYDHRDELDKVLELAPLVSAKETDDETIRLLRRIEKNTSATHFWTRVTGIPVLIGMIVGFLMAMEKCS